MPMKTDPFEAQSVFSPDPAFFGMLGLARRAGKIKPGAPTVMAQLKGGGKPALVLIDAHASSGTRRKLWGLCYAKGVPYLTVRSERSMAEAVGMDAPVAALAVTDEGFAQRLISLCNKECTPPYETATERGDKEWQ